MAAVAMTAKRISKRYGSIPELEAESAIAACGPRALEISRSRIASRRCSSGRVASTRSYIPAAAAPPDASKVLPVTNEDSVYTCAKVTEAAAMLT
ncbi:unnamed protein product [Miscanthus lutarioriparius]|uniref:Uncharacterized protein n=1 Tax=Miscanthus lutarioriparius TaxID=422564 RepID=A0A811R3N7_9POAL|nr:unnamed protein product [Miscanthus lutarioriparius]